MDTLNTAILIFDGVEVLDFAGGDGETRPAISQIFL